MRQSFATTFYGSSTGQISCSIKIHITLIRKLIVGARDVYEDIVLIGIQVKYESQFVGIILSFNTNPYTIRKGLTAWFVFVYILQGPGSIGVLFMFTKDLSLLCQVRHESTGKLI